MTSRSSSVQWLNQNGPDPALAEVATVRSSAARDLRVGMNREACVNEVRLEIDLNLSQHQVAAQ